MSESVGAPTVIRSPFSSVLDMVTDFCKMVEVSKGDVPERGVRCKPEISICRLRVCINVIAEPWLTSSKA